MNITGYVKVEEIVENVFREAGYQTIDWDKALHHIGRALSLLGVPQLYIEEVTSGEYGHLPPVQIEEYKGKLPSNMVYLIQAREYTSKTVLHEATSNFHMAHTPSNSSTRQRDNMIDYEEFYNLTQEQVEEDPELRAKFYNFKNQYQTELESAMSPISKNEFTSALNYDYQLEYKLQGGWIFTNFEQGLVELSYKAFPIDEDGRPLIPDDEKVKRACEAYLTERLDYERWRKGLIADKVYQLSDREKSWAMASAKSHASQMDLGEAESFRAMWSRLIPDIRTFDGYNKFTGIDERRR